MNNILIVDDDPGFILWLGRALLGANQQPLPACSVNDAIVLTTEPCRIDLLIINSALPQCSELVDLLRRSHTKLKVIALEAKNKLVNGRPRMARVDAWRRKPARQDKSAKQEWLAAVEQAISHQTD